MLTPGDVIEIPLPDGRSAAGQYLGDEPNLGPLLQVYDRIAVGPLQVADLEAARPLFPPVAVDLSGAVTRGEWRLAGSLPLGEVERPKFVSARYSDKTGVVFAWFLWEASVGTALGPVLPQAQRGLEYRVLWSPADIVERIQTGQVPFPYGDLLRDNTFVPRRPANSSRSFWDWFRRRV